MENNNQIRFIKPLGFIDYIQLQMKACCVLSDSGTLTEESSILGFPAVMLRESHERPEGMDSGTLVMSGLDDDKVLDCIQTVTAQKQNGMTVKGLITDYQNGNVSEKIIRIILSYTQYINRTVWYKDNTAVE